MSLASSACASVVLLLLLGFLHGTAATPCYPAMFVFGDSLSDTGNGPLTGIPRLNASNNRPFGETQPGHPDGRFSDGYLIIDFLASFLQLPFVNPSLNSTADFSHGISYAVTGATALNSTTLAQLNIVPITNDSLDVQRKWHADFKASIPPTGAPGKPTASAFADGLYVISIGGRDYTDAFQSNYTPAYVNTTILPMVIRKIKHVAESLHRLDARNFLFVSILPLGCSSSYLATFGGSPLTPRDSDGCLRDYNSVAYNHGVSLQNAVESLRLEYPRARFAFADYYGAYSHILENRLAYGFLHTLDACCGAPTAPYRFSMDNVCGVNSTVSNLELCVNPNFYMNWDGVHFTNHCNQNVTSLFTSGSYLDPSDGLSCPTS